MDENSEDCELQMKHIRSRSRSHSTTTIPRTGKRAQTINRLMSDLSSVISNSFDRQIKEEVSLDYQRNELSFEGTGKNLGLEGYRKLVEHKYFLVCISCFWCISLEVDEFYRFNHSMTKGIELEFSNNIQVSSGP